MSEEVENKEPSEDNVVPAMDKVASSIKMSRKTNTGSEPGEPAAKQVLLRASESDHLRWKEAADKKGVSLAEFIREVVNREVSAVLDCPHPTNMKRFYPWATTCLACGQQWVTEKRKPRKFRGA